MKPVHSLVLIVVVLMCGAGSLPAQPVGQGNAAPASGSCPAKSTDPANKVLDSMDALARRFSSVRAAFVWDQYESVVNEHTVQSGVMWVSKTPRGMEMAADIGNAAGAQGQQKYVVFKEGRVQVYQPAIDQLTEYSAGKNREAVESFLVLGFGGGGHKLCENFSIAYAGRENVHGQATDKLELTPLKASVKGIFNRIILWIDADGISVQQKFIEPATGNYRLATYNHIEINAKINDKVFKAPITSKTHKIVQQ